MSDETQGFNFSDLSVADILDPNTSFESSENASSQDETDTSSDQADQNQEESDQSTDNDAQTAQEESQQEQSDDSQEGKPQEGEDQDDNAEGADFEDGPTIIEELQEIVGVEVAEGEEFPDDIQGIAQYTKKAGEQLGQQYLADLFEAFPDVKAFLDFRTQGGDAEKYFELVNASSTYENVNEASLKDNPALQKTVVAELYKKTMGMSEEDIKDTIKDLEDSELLLKHSVKSAARLNAIAQENKNAEIARQAEESQRIKEQQVETWKQINDTISEGNLKGFTVPETDKKAFYDWMSKPVDSKGTTQRQVDMQEMDMESTLALEYLYYSKFNLGKLAKNYKATKRSNSLRNRLKTQQSTNSPAQRMSGGPKGGNSRTVSLPSLKDVL